MNRSPLVRIGLWLEKASNSRVLLSLFVAAMLVFPTLLLYNSLQGSWDRLSRYSKRAENKVFPHQTTASKAAAPANDGVAGPPGALPAETPEEATPAPPASSDKRLLHVIETWDRLPENIRQAVDALVQPYVVEKAPK